MTNGKLYKVFFYWNFMKKGIKKNNVSYWLSVAGFLSLIFVKTLEPFIVYRSVESLEDKVFVDTEKPNALITIPEADSRAFRTISNLKIYRGFESEYDVNFKIIGDKKELYHEIKETPDTELLVIGGHGGDNKIYFSDERKRNKENYKKLNLLKRALSESTGKEFEEIQRKSDSLYNQISDVADCSSLSLKDSTELKQCFKNLPPNARIWLNSCSSYVLVDKFKEFARPDVKVMGIRGDGSVENIRINNLYPLDILITKTTKNGVTTYYKGKEGIYEK